MIEPGLSRGSFKEYCDHFVSYLEQSGRSQLTLKNYRSDLKAFEQWLETSEARALNPTTFGNKEMEQYQEFLLTDQRLQLNTVKRRLGTLRNFYTWLQQTGLSPPAPIPRLTALTHVDPTVPVDPVVRGPFISQAERLRLLETVEQGQNPRDIAIIKLIIYAGLRVGELCNLRWSDIAMTTHESQLLVRSASGKHSRAIELSPEAVCALVDLGYQAKAGSQESVFVGQRGGMTSRGVQDVVKKYAKQAGLKDVTPHTLRHVYATRLLEQGVHLSDIATLMGASAKTVLGYEKLLPQQPSIKQ